MKNNIELFDEYVARIFSDLYQSFPIPIGLNACRISESETLDNFGRPLGSDGEPSKAIEICKSTIDWIAEAGHIKTTHGNQYGYAKCVLTAKGLEVLKSVPDSIQVKNSLGESLVAALRTGSMGAATELGKCAVRMGAGIGHGLVEKMIAGS